MMVSKGTQKVYEGVWKECPDVVDNSRKYNVDEGNPRVATKINRGRFGKCCTATGNTLIPLSKVTSWNIKILKSRDNDGDNIYIGVAPFDINQNDDNYCRCGWYFCCCYLSLWSGPPHSYDGKEYGPRGGDEQYIRTGDSVGVVMDTAKGELSFILNGVGHGFAYEGIPLDKPLVPCVLLWNEGNSVELNTSEVKENEADSSVPIPSNITIKGTPWDSITLTWDEVSDASFYQIEVDGSRSWDASTTNIFAKKGLFPETEHSFRVRTVRKSSVGEWSDIVKGRTLKAPEFSGCVWKKCPDDIDDDMKYSVDEKNPRIATKVNSNDWCTIIGNTLIPLNKITSFNVKVLKSGGNDGCRIYIGVAPFDINQNEWCNREECGWYFDCYDSTLYSGPPHNYDRKEYGPRKERGQYVHTGDSVVGVVMDTANGELSFILNGVGHGVAYCGIPLNEPLIPCVILGLGGDSVELVI